MGFSVTYPAGLFGSITIAVIVGVLILSLVFVITAFTRNRDEDPPP